MPIRLGNKADREDFFDREREREDLWRRLDGNRIELSGPRRLGKTSPLRRLGRNLAPSGLIFPSFLPRDYWRRNHGR